MYKVLFVDDEIGNDFTTEFIRYARRKSIEIEGEQFHKDAIEKLVNDKIHEYDAVILDVMGYYDEVKGTEREIGVGESLEAIRVIKETQGRLIPWFIFTAKLNDESDEGFIEKIRLTQEKTDKFSREGKDFYEKTADTNILVKDIIVAIENRKETNALYKYRSQLKTLIELGASNNEIDGLKDILKSVQALDDKINPVLHFNTLRKCLEYVYRGLVTFKILPPDVINDKDEINLTESSRFLAGLDTSYIPYTCSKSHFPKILAENVKLLSYSTSSAGHTSEKKKEDYVDYNHYSQNINSPFLLYQFSFVILDLLLWYKNYTALNNDTEENKRSWVEKDNSNEKIVTIKYDGHDYYSGDYLFYHKYVEENEHEGRKVEIIVDEEYKYGNKYKRYVKRYKVID